MRFTRFRRFLLTLKNIQGVFTNVLLSEIFLNIIYLGSIELPSWYKREPWISSFCHYIDFLLYGFLYPKSYDTQSNNSRVQLAFAEVIHNCNMVWCPNQLSLRRCYTSNHEQLYKPNSCDYRRNKKYLIFILVSSIIIPPWK